ncbi:VWA domain-containing protein [Paenibacillus periandrae]|uniref:VWA domain-containing protein n=1 Tax=Paenibacillus periandrae TaxID=1761741 RepID=UPI0030840130
MVESSTLPIFWQFVGIANLDFVLLRKLEEMEGRFVDNANFFHLDDISIISAEYLYDHFRFNKKLLIKIGMDRIARQSVGLRIRMIVQSSL